MDSQEILNKLEYLESKTQLLVQRYSSLKQELAIAIEKNRDLESQLKKYKAEIANLENQYKISKIVSTIAPDAENSEELKDKIDEYLVEIDKCIAFLSK